MTEPTKAWLKARLGRFCRDTAGGIAIIFALSATVLVAFLGAGLDLSRAYIARQELSNVATMACQYSTRPSVYSTAYSNDDGITAYTTKVNTFLTSTLSSQNLSVTQTTGTPFSFTTLGSSGTVSLTASVPTMFLPIVRINSIPVTVNTTCAVGQTQNNAGGSSVVLAEGFENSACSGTCWSNFEPNGAQNHLTSTPTNTFPSNVGYVGSGNAEWTIMGYCLEVDTVGLIKSTVAEGTHSAELDCDNGSGSRGNSSISNKTYYTAGTYEIRYSYSGRIVYPNYDPIYICASTAADVAWANDSNSVGAPSSGVTRSNQMNVYFDQDNNGAPATHTTSDGTQTLAGQNLIDVCVYSIPWIQRSITVTVSTPGYYWLSFAADGSNDSYGAQLDNIMVCRTSCSGSVADNFPGDWGTTPLLYEDTFESPAYTGTTQVTEDLSDDYGSHGGWPSADDFGWAIGPYNQVEYIRSTLASQGSQSLMLDSSQISGQTTSQRSMSRYFYLVPGYYKIQYDYIGEVKFGSTTGVTCTYAPTTSTALSTYSSTTGTTATNRITGSNISPKPAKDSNAIAVFMSQSLEISTPIVSTTTDATTSYLNPTGTTTTTPTVAPDSLSLSNYNTAQVNPVLDYCNYSSSWTTRTTYVKITKPGQYWLTIASKGTADKLGGAIDDVRLTALNSLYGSAPSFSVTIPTGGQAVGSTVSYTGFSFTANPLTP